MIESALHNKNKSETGVTAGLQTFLSTVEAEINKATADGLKVITIDVKAVKKDILRLAIFELTKLGYYCLMQHDYYGGSFVSEHSYTLQIDWQ